MLDGMHSEQIAIENADILHAGAVDPKQVVRVRIEEVGVDRKVLFDVRL